MNPYICAGVGAVHLTLIPLVLAGYEGLFRAAICATYFVYSCLLIAFAHHFLAGTASFATSIVWFAYL